jgi:YVTN family beta-propeller protein
LDLLLTGRTTLAAGLAVLLVVVSGAVARGSLPPTPLVRTIAVGRMPSAMAVDTRRGRVFVANEGANSVSMLDARTGAVLATTGVGLAPTALAVDETAGRVFVLTAGAALTSHDSVSVLDAGSGRLLRTLDAGVGVGVAAVADGRGHIFVTDQADNSVSMLDAQRGRLLRTVPVGPAPAGIAVDAQAGHVLIVNQGTFQPAPAFYPHEHGTVTVLDARSGTVLRTVTVGYGPGALALDARRGRAFVANRYDGTVSVVDVATGAVLRTVTVAPQPAAAAVNAPMGQVFIASDNAGTGLVSVLDAAEGRVLHRVSVGERVVELAVEERHGQVLVVTKPDIVPPTEPGHLHVLDGRTGHLRRTVTVGLQPRALAVDAAANRAFVLNGGGTVRDAWVERGAVWLRRWVPWLRPQTTAIRTIPATVSVLDTTCL